MTAVFLFLAVLGALALAGCGGASSSPSPANVPSAPAGLSAVAGSGHVSLFWTASPGSAGYNVYRGTASGALSAKQKIQSGITGTSYVDRSVSNGTTYYYQTTAVNSAGESQPSGEVSATPSVLSKAICGARSLASNQMPVCFANAEDGSFAGSINEPYVTVFIANSSGVLMPFDLLLDTGVTGVLVNRSALQAAGVSVPRTNETFSGAFGDGSTFGGYVSSASVSTLSPGGFTAAGFPIAVNEDSIFDAFPTGDFLEGDFGMGMSGSVTFGGVYDTPSLVSGLPASYTNGFLLQFQTGINADGYGTSGGGVITFGLDAANTSGYSFFPAEGAPQSFITLYASFGGAISASGSRYTAVLDTGTTFMDMDEAAMERASGIAVINGSRYEYDGGLVNGGLLMGMGLFNGAGYDGSAAFTTSPNAPSLNYEFPAGIFNYTSGFLLLENTVLDIGPAGNQELMGMPYLLDYPLYFAAPSFSKGWGVGIKFN